MKRILFLTAIIGSLASAAFSQDETLTNAQIVEMVRSGLGRQIIISIINDSADGFDLSPKALVELKKAGVEDEVILSMIEKNRERRRTPSADPDEKPAMPPNDDAKAGYSESGLFDRTFSGSKTVPTAKEALLNARTLAIVKSSLHPSRQALEKALFKRREWSKYNLTIVRYKEEADLYIEIGRIPLTWLSHRYAFRIYDRRSGAVITAGETTSWGSLAENLAREITQKMEAVSGK